jgi:hypothetical protein
VVDAPGIAGVPGALVPFGGPHLLDRVPD